MSSVKEKNIFVEKDQHSATIKTWAKRIKRNRKKDDEAEEEKLFLQHS